MWGLQGSPRGYEFSKARSRVRLWSLGLTVLLTMSLIIAACGNGDDTNDDAAGSGDDAATEEPSGAGDEITIFGWGGVFDHAIPSFTEETGIEVNASYWSGEEDGLARVRVDPEGIDIVMFCVATAFEQLRDRDMLAEIDVDQLENWELIHPDLRENLPFMREDGVIDNVPFDWGATGLLWDESQTGTGFDSWEVMLDEEYEGRVGLQDSAQGVFNLAMLIEGKDPMDIPTETEDIDALIPTVNELMENVRTFWSSGDDLVQLIGSGEVWVTNAWDGLSVQLLNEGFEDIQFIRAPQEGSIGWSCGMQILSDAPNPDGAMQWIDHFISTEIQTEYTRNVGYACVNVECHEELAETDPELYEMTGLDRADIEIPRLLIHEAWPEEILDYAIEKWTEIKAGG